MTAKQKKHLIKELKEKTALEVDTEDVQVRKMANQNIIKDLQNDIYRKALNKGLKREGRRI